MTLDEIGMFLRQYDCWCSLAHVEHYVACVNRHYGEKGEPREQIASGIGASAEEAIIKAIEYAEIKLRKNTGGERPSRR